VLGVAGLVPFFAAVAAVAFAPAPLNVVAPGAYFAYAAVILSFLGGARWGFEVAIRPEAPGFLTLVGAVLPSILGWGAVIAQMVAAQAALGALMAGHALMWLWDAASSGPGGRRLPEWYPALRTVLTVGVLVSGALMFWLMGRPA
jgi:hypothetical protein